MCMKTPEQIKQEAEAALQRGNAFYEKQEYDPAIESYSEAIRLDPNNASAYLYRGGMYFWKKQYELAIKDCTESIRLDPNNAQVYYYRGEIYYRKKDYDLAIKDYNEAIRLRPDLFGIFYINKENCSYCRLPHELTHGSIAIGNEIFICAKCINKAETMEKIKQDNEALYHQIIEDYQQYLAFHKKIDSMDTFEKEKIWLTDLTIDELRTKARQYKKPNPIIINNVPIHKNQSVELLEGEIFRKHTEKDVEVSNLGRVKYGDQILEQYDPHNNGYLFVDIESMGKTSPEKVYRLVAETWLEKPDLKEYQKDSKSFCYNTVHHISNNGYDNRRQNLMWVTEWQHAMIHPWISIDKFDSGELNYLFESYAEINITPYDYQRITNIVKRRKQLWNDVCNSSGKNSEFYSHTKEQMNNEYDKIIEAMEDLED